MAAEIGIELLTEEQYRELQQLGEFDTKTSSWLKTPAEVRKLGGLFSQIAASDASLSITIPRLLIMVSVGSGAVSRYKSSDVLNF